MEENRDYAKECGIRCRQIRMSKGMSQQALAEKMSVTPAAISKWEKEGVSNISHIMKLSNALGQDITADQFDQEGSIGEVGKEILSILVKNRGVVDFGTLEHNMYGMKSDRISNELFKLERIGAVIREQFQDYLHNERDGIFITAKGAIAYKNTLGGKKSILLENILTMDERLVNGATSYQEVVDSDVITGILMRIDSKNSFRCDYLTYLYKNYFHPIINEEHVIWPCYEGIAENMLGNSAYIDILRRMAQRATRDIIDELFSDVIRSTEDDDYDEQAYMVTYWAEHIAAGLDEKEFDALKYFGNKVESAPHIMNVDFTEEDWDIQSNNPIVKDAITEMTEFNKECEEGSYNDYYTHPMYQDLNDNEVAFFSSMDENTYKWPRKWFSYDEIKAFIEANIRLAETDAEKEISDNLKKIWETDNSTMEYYYSFPQAWEENGLAQLVRDRVGIPNRAAADKEE